MRLSRFIKILNGVIKERGNIDTKDAFCVVLPVMTKLNSGSPIPDWIDLFIEEVKHSGRTIIELRLNTLPINIQYGIGEESKDGEDED